MEIKNGKHRLVGFVDIRQLHKDMKKVEGKYSGLSSFKAMSTRIRNFFFPQIFFCGCENFRVQTQRIRIVFSRPHVSDCIRKFSDLL